MLSKDIRERWESMCIVLLLFRLKDASKESIVTETKQMLVDLGLESKSQSYPTELSGGMQRKLSIAIAFIGNSTTVILDEPTAGMLG